MSVLTKKEIFKLVKDGKMCITPILNQKESFDNISLNVRLSNQFIRIKKQSFSLFDIAKKTANIEQYQQKIIINYNKPFILHPNELVLGSTLEYLSLPKNIAGYVVGKSSWGRVGLIIATAIKIDPCFKGCITLEIINGGESPIVLYPGVLIAQIVLHNANDSTCYNGDFQFSVGPKFPNFSKKIEEVDFWLPKE